jgi:hypothetical protein
LLTARNSAKQLAKLKIPILYERSAGETGGWGFLQTSNSGCCNGDPSVDVALWALADDLLAEPIDANNRRLAAVEWKSRTNIRIIELVAPFSGERRCYDRSNALSS